MATPIKDTPVLTGEDARRFEKTMKENENKVISPEERARILHALQTIRVSTGEAIVDFYLTNRHKYLFVDIIEKLGWATDMEPVGDYPNPIIQMAFLNNVEVLFKETNIYCDQGIIHSTIKIGRLQDAVENKSIFDNDSIYLRLDKKVTHVSTIKQFRAAFSELCMLTCEIDGELEARFKKE